MSRRQISWGARGLMAFLQVRAAQQISIPEIVAASGPRGKKLGRDGIYALLTELVGAGHLRRSQKRNPDGTMGEVEYFIQRGLD